MFPRLIVTLLASAVLLAGCATAGGPAPAGAPVSVAKPEPPSAPVPIPVPAPEPAPAPAPAPAPSSGVGYLAANAERQAAAGQFEQAASILERALRIDPRNARLWHQLARVRFDQSRWPLAVQFASKSNQLAGADRPLRSSNYRLLADAYTALGQRQKAEEAKRLAEMR